MAKIGRNAPCSCNSGRKFKRCCGAQYTILAAPLLERRNGRTSQAELVAANKRVEALKFQRQRQQGRGRPIISIESNGTRFVAIGSRTAYGRMWLTFQDFLFSYVKSQFGPAWGSAQIAKPKEERHPFAQWVDALATLMIEHASDSQVVSSMPEYGAARAVFGLAYDLYLIEHHARNEGDTRAFERLIERLKKDDQFFGARHEARAAGILLRAGFDLTWEDEELRRPGGHAEFVASYPRTGRCFWVECKMRQPQKEQGSESYTYLVSDALQKETELERLVFVELNLQRGRMNPETGGWPKFAVDQLRILENQPSAAKLPSAILVLSNYPEHRNLDALIEGAGILIEGFKTDRYRLGEPVDLLAEINAREESPEIEDLWRSIQEHSFLPATFDGTIPGLEESQRLLLGHSYELPDGTVAVLEEATVVSQWRQAVGMLRRPSGELEMIYFDLSDDELVAWQRHPETFFGELRPHREAAKDSLDMFEFFRDAYSQTPRESLLEFMSNHSDIADLKALPQQELVKVYAYRLVASIAQRGESPSPPAWHRRLKRIRKLKAAD